MEVFKDKYRFSHFLFTRNESSTMKQETIQYKSKSLIKTTKANGAISYTKRGVYIGTDSKTGKKITVSITAKTLKEFERKIRDAKLNFEQQGSTKKQNVQIDQFEDLVELWFESFQIWTSSENTRNRVRGYLDNYILPRFGAYKPEQIEASDVQLWVNQLATNAQKMAVENRRRSAKGKARDFALIIYKLKDIFDFGITNFHLTNNPVQTIKIPPKPRTNAQKVKVLTDEGLAKWLKFLDELPNSRGNRRFKVICNTLLHSALRINELLALTIDDLDFETNELSISKTLMWKAADKKRGLKGQMVCKFTPKSESGNRKVLVPQAILESLKAFHDEMNAYFQVHHLPQSELIFPTIYGNYMCDRNERTTLKKRLSALGLPDYGFHLFRHTHASMLLNSGANWKELQVRMGHKSIATTMDVYAELAPQKKAEAVVLIQQKLKELTT